MLPLWRFLSERFLKRPHFRQKLSLGAYLVLQRLQIFSILSLEIFFFVFFFFVFFFLAYFSINLFWAAFCFLDGVAINSSNGRGVFDYERRDIFFRH